MESKTSTVEGPGLAEMMEAGGVGVGWGRVGRADLSLVYNANPLIHVFKPFSLRDSLTGNYYR
ncbi:hypothetical protein BaRGS_00000006, partial [Batillaria attramentaria]